MSKTTYYCAVEGMIQGAHRKVNDELVLSEREAKYLLMSGLIGKEKKADSADKRAEPSPVDLDMKTRKG